jgi:hypothetical protein
MPDAPSPYDYAATDCRVVDGDTVEVTLVKATDVGFGVLVTAHPPAPRRPRRQAPAHAPGRRGDAMAARPGVRDRHAVQRAANTDGEKRDGGR